MRRTIISFGLLAALILLAATSFSQQTWKEMMHDPGVNVYDVVEEAEAYFETVDKEAKGSGWKKYQRWLYETEPKFYPSGDRSTVDPYLLSKAYDTFLKNTPPEAKPSFDNGWFELGPYYIETVTGHYSAGLGRVETFYVDPNNPQRIYIGSRSGGFWKSLDGGATWTGNTTDNLIASGVNTMTVSPTNPNHILINVRNASNGTTHGIYRSTDAGDTWAETNFNPTNLGWGGLGEFHDIYVVAYHPTIANLVFVGSDEGIHRSGNDLSSWTNPVPTLNFRAFAFHPTNPNIIYAATTSNNSVIYRSTNAGVSFTTAAIPGNTSSVKLSTSADCPSCVFVGTSAGIWKSVDEGINFTQVSTPGLSNYGAYAVSDVDTSYHLFGNIDVNMSSDGGKTFSKTTFWSQGNANYNTTGTYVHADIRGSRSINGVFWVNTDGFICKSLDNGITWTLYEGQSIRENYNLGVSQSNHYRTISGSQDNGTSIRTENGWIEFFGADGMEGIIHPLNDDFMMGSFQNGGRRRTTDGGFTQTSATPSGQSGAWIAPLFYDPNDQMTVYHCGDTIYRSDDFGSTWTKLGTPGFSGTINYAAIAENNSNIMVVTKSSNIEKSVDGGLTFTSIKGTLPNEYIRDVAFDPNDDNVIVVVYGTYDSDNEKVFISFNQGASWSNITYNLGNMPIRSVAIDHSAASTIYLGAEIGVYKKAMNATTWTLYNPGLPNMATLELEVVYGSNTLRGATWGRGLWEYALDGRKDYPAIVSTRITDQPTDLQPRIGVDQYVTSKVSYDNSLSSVYLEWSANTPIFGNVINMSNTTDSTWVSDLPLPNLPVGTKVYFKVFAVGSNGDVSETYKFMYTVKDFMYCESFGNMSYQTAVTLVDFNDINNSTGKTQPYTDYTGSDSTLLVPGDAYDLTVNVNTDGNYTIYAKAWIDWNRDADFDDADEEIDLGLAVNTPNGPTSLSPVNVAVPPDAVPGPTTMRVAAKYNSSPILCQTNFDGEVEDYRIVISGDAACPKPTGVATTNIDYISATLAWNAVAGADHYVIRGGLLGMDPANYVMLTIPSGATSSFNVSGLSVGTSYEWQIAAFCDDSDTLASDWSELELFTTLGCDPPSFTNTGNITSTSATLAWGTVSNASGYEIRGRVSGFNPFVTLQVASGATNTFNVSGLTPGTGYEWQIRAKCASGLLSSDYTPMTIFITSLGSSQKTGADPIPEPSISVYPVPAYDLLTVELSGFDADERLELSLYDLNGRRLLSQTVFGSEKLVNLDVRRLPVGVYQLMVGGEGFQQVERVVVGE